MTILSPKDRASLRLMGFYRRELARFRRSAALFHIAFCLCVAGLLGAAGATLAAPIEPSSEAVTTPVIVGAGAAAAADPAAVALPEFEGEVRAQALAVRDDPRVAFAMLLSLFAVTAAIAGLFLCRQPSGDKRSRRARERYLDL